MRMVLDTHRPETLLKDVAGPKGRTMDTARKVAAIAWITVFVGTIWFVAGGLCVQYGAWMEFVAVLPILLSITALEVWWWWMIFFKSSPDPDLSDRA